MKDGFIKVAAATPQIEVADCIHNTQEIIKKGKGNECSRSQNSGFS